MKSARVLISLKGILVFSVLLVLLILRIIIGHYIEQISKYDQNVELWEPTCNLFNRTFT